MAFKWGVTGGWGGYRGASQGMGWGCGVPFFLQGREGHALSAIGPNSASGASGNMFVKERRLMLV